MIPGTKTKMKILRNIYENPGINVSELIKKTKTSPNRVLEYINELEEFEVLERTKENRKKLPVRNLYIKWDSELTLHILSLVEINKKQKIIKKYKKLRTIKKQLCPLLQRGNFCIIYGSYARGGAEKDSDIDLLVVGDNLDKNKIKEVFITFPEASVKIETKKQFHSNINKPLYQNILSEHAILCNAFDYVSEIKEYRNKLNTHKQR